MQMECDVSLVVMIIHINISEIADEMTSSGSRIYFDYME